MNANTELECRHVTGRAAIRRFGLDRTYHPLRLRLSNCLVAVFIETLTFGQGFNERYDAFGWGFPQEAYGVERTTSGYTIITSSADCDSISPDECFFHASVLLTHIGLTGNKIWEKRSWRPVHSTFAGWANCCDTIPGGGYIVGGNSEATDGSDEVYLMRFDANGDTLWTKVFGDPTLNRFWLGQQVKRTTEGGFAIVGITDQNGPFNGFVIKTDSEGNEEWTRIYEWDSTTEGGLGAIALAGDGTYYVGGSRGMTAVDTDSWVAHLDANGGVLWQVSFGGPWQEGGTEITTLADGDLAIFSARGYAASFSLLRPCILKVDHTNGDILWEQEYGPSALTTTLFAGKETPTGDLIACGVTYANSDINSVQQGLLLRTNSEGDSLWMRSYYYQDDVISNGQGRFYDVLPTDDGGFIAAGAAYNPVDGPNPPGYSQDTWVVKVDGDGCIVPGCNAVGVTEQATNLMDALRVWPNPVVSGGAVTVHVELPPALHGSDLVLSVVAADGRLLQSARMNGTNQQLTTDDWASGLYHLHISSGQTWYTGGQLVVE